MNAASPVERPCVIVAGMGRCGTSLMMQMLHAAGVPCFGRWPDFETDASSVGGFDARKFAALSCCAIKLIDPANLPVANLPHHAVIWLDRDSRQQAKSQAKFSMPMGLSVGRAGVRAIEADLRRSRNRHRTAIGVPGRCDHVDIWFEHLIQQPGPTAGILAGFLAAHGWHVDPEVMAKQVRARNSDCLPGFLEVDLIAEKGVCAMTTRSDHIDRDRYAGGGLR